MGLSDMGNMAHQNWAAIPGHFDHVALDEWVIMPNHVHGLIGIMDWPVGGNNKFNPGSVETRNFASLRDMSKPSENKFGPLKPGSLSAIMQAYKSSVTRWARKNDYIDFAWQPRFHDHIVRNDRSMNRIRDYIIHNPLKWNSDCFFDIE